MSTPQPPRRRRIAGESQRGPAQPGAPVPRTSPIRKAARKAAKASSTTVARPTPPPPPPPAPPRAAASRGVDAESTGRARRLDLSVLRGSGRLVSLVALTVAALVFGGWFGYQGWNDWRGDDVVSAHAEAAATAAASAETIFTYQYDKLDEHLEDAQATMTTSFATKFETISPALNDLAPQRRIQVRASTRDAAALECGNDCDVDEASVLVFIDQARLADGEEQPTVFGNRIRLEMVRQDGAWLVDEITAL